MKRYLLFGLALAAAASRSAVAAAQAADTSDVRSLLDENVVTTASKTAEPDTVAPATTTMITSDDMRRYGIHTVAEALNFLSMGVIADSLQGLDADDVGGRGVLITGDSGLHFLVMINGHIVNQAKGSTGFYTLIHETNVPLGAALGVPLEMIDHIEVTLGPGSVLYGSNAMLGIINVVTKRVDAFRGLHLAVDSQLATTGRGFVGAGHSFTLLGVPAEVTAGVEYFRRRGPDIVFDQQRSPRDIWGGTAHTNNADVPSGVLTLTLGNVEVNARVTEKKVGLATQGTFDDRNAYDMERRLSVDARYHVEVSPVMGVSARVYADSFDYQGQYSFYNSMGLLSVPTVTTAYWSKADLQSSFDWFQNGRFVTLVGAEGTYRQVEELVITQFDQARLLITHYAHHDLPVAAYAQQTWQPNPWLAFNAGARVDYDDRFPAVASPRVAASVKPWKGGTLKAIYSAAFRAPSLNESYETWTLRSAPVGLAPERVQSVEGSIHEKFNDQRLHFGVFGSEWQNLIYLHTFTAADAAAGLGLTGALQEQNRASFTNVGFNAGFDGALGDGGRLRYGVTLTGAVALLDGGGDLPASPHTFGNARVSYALPGDWPVLAVAGYFMTRRRADEPSQTYQVPSPLPYAPAKVELRPTISGPVPSVRGLSYRLTLNYVFGSYDPYLVGPNASELLPVEKVRGTVGLAYDF